MRDRKGGRVPQRTLCPKKPKKELRAKTLLSTGKRGMESPKTGREEEGKGTR